MTQPLLLTDRPSYFPSGMHYVYDGRSKRYPRQPVLPDLSTSASRQPQSKMDKVMDVVQMTVEARHVWPMNL